MKKYVGLLVLIVMVALLVASCGEPEIVEKEVTVVETVEVEKEVTIVETVEVEKVVEVPVEEEELAPLVFSCFNASHPVVRLMRLGFWDACRDYDFNCEEVLVMEPDIDQYVSALDQVSII